MDIKKNEELSPELYEVARKGGTEAPFTGKYWDNHEKGMFKCAICGTELFSSDTKFESGSGWPSFTEPATAASIELHPDRSLFMERTEVTCATCGGHLGHVFDDGPDGCQRFCINSVALELDDGSTCEQHANGHERPGAPSTRVGRTRSVAWGFDARAGQAPIRSSSESSGEA